MLITDAMLVTFKISEKKTTKQNKKETNKQNRKTKRRNIHKQRKFRCIWTYLPLAFAFKSDILSKIQANDIKIP